MRGDVYELKSRPGARGHEQRGRRYCVIVQSDDFPWSTALAAPTSASAPAGMFRPRIDLGENRSVVLVDQVGPVDSGQSLGRMVGRVSLGEMQQIEDALRLVLSL